jgi:hypothetical protein
MAPPFAFIMGRVAARMRLKAPVRFTSSWRCQSSSFTRMTSWSTAMPALLTRTWRPPKAPTTSSTAAAQAAGSATSNFMSFTAGAPAFSQSAAASCAAASLPA